MKKFIVLSLICFISLATNATLPDLIGQKASFRNLEAFNYYNTKSTQYNAGDKARYGRAVHTYDQYFPNALITGHYNSQKFTLTSDENGLVTNITYTFDSTKEDFDLRRERILNLYDSNLLSTKDDTSIYTATMSGITRFIVFTHKPDGKSVVAFRNSKLKSWFE